MTQPLSPLKGDGICRNPLTCVSRPVTCLLDCRRIINVFDWGTPPPVGHGVSRSAPVVNPRLCHSPSEGSLPSQCTGDQGRLPHRPNNLTKTPDRPLTSENPTHDLPPSTRSNTPLDVPSLWKRDPPPVWTVSSLEYVSGTPGYSETLHFRRELKNPERCHRGRWCPSPRHVYIVRDGSPVNGRSTPLLYIQPFLDSGCSSCFLRIWFIHVWNLVNSYVSSFSREGSLNLPGTLKTTFKISPLFRPTVNSHVGYHSFTSSTGETNLD